ncbi:MAG: CbtB domain-containing protein [Rhodospirillales bacterium]
MTIKSNVSHRSVHATIGERAVPATLALLFGVFLIFGTGFANSNTVHNAAHDTRHAFSFPCH